MAIAALFNTDNLTATELLDHALRLEASGVESMWLPELFGREPMALAGALLARTSRLVVASGIANIYARDAVAAACAARTLAELSGGRFVLGLGVSNAGLNGARGHAWRPPVPAMKGYLEAMRAATVTLPPGPAAPVLIAAHASGLIALARSHADGITTYMMTPEHTRRARAALGDGPQITAMVMALRCTDPVRARDLARRATRMYTVLDYYHRAWSQLGFGPEDFGRTPSDRLIDALVAWGDVEAIAARVAEHRAAGATRVVVVAPRADDPDHADLDLLAALAA